MRLLFRGTTFFAALFSLLSAAGFVHFETLRAEAIGKNSFEFFMLLLLFVVGVRGLLASRQTPFLFQLAGTAVTATQAAYTSVSGAFVGWIIGITVFALINAEPRNVAFGLFLLLWMLLFLNVPLIWKREIEKQARQYFELRFKERSFPIIFRLSCIGLIGISIWGVTQLYG